MKHYSTFVGMDVHKTSIEIAIAQQGRNGECPSTAMKRAQNVSDPEMRIFFAEHLCGVALAKT